MKPSIPQESLELFTQLALIAPAPYTSALDELSSLLISQCHSWIRPDPASSPAAMSKQLFGKHFGQLSQSDQANLEIALIARLVLKTPELAEKENLPDSILAYYPAAFDRLAAALKRKYEQPLEATNDLFNRAGFVLAVNVPCGAQLLDTSSSIFLSSVVLAVGRERSLKPLLRYFRCNGPGIWFRGHTDPEFLDEFNEAGWDHFYLLLAELLQRRQHVRGLVGTSWFYDPNLVDVSPNLAYLQLRQVERGAYLMRHKQGRDSDIMFATRTSGTRRRLYEEGKYIPTSYSLIWEREKILSWAKTR